MEKKSFNGRFVENSGASAADLERGYSNTGAIPETGESISGAQANADKEAKEGRITAPCAKRTIGTARKSAAVSLITIAANEA